MSLTDSNFISRLSGAWNILWSKNGYKHFFNSRPELLGRRGAVYLDVAVPYNLYNSIPQLRTVIDKKALMFANMELKVVSERDGKDVDDKEFRTLMANPNILQSMNDWLRQYKAQEQIYGNQFIYKNQPSRLSKYPASLQNISPAYMRPMLTGKLFDQVELKGVIEKYIYCVNTAEKYFDVEDILWSRITDLDNPLLGSSPLKPLEGPLTNTKYAYDYLNVISNEKGGIGILSMGSGNKDGMGAVPLNPVEKNNIESQYRDTYGIGNRVDGSEKRRVMITEASLNWQPMSYPTKDLLLMEQIDANFLAIIDHFGLNVNIFSSKSQTYENVKNAIIQCYQDTIQPEADQFAQSLSKFIGVAKGMRLQASYAHLAILQKDKGQEATTLQTALSGLNSAITAGLLTKPEAMAILDNTFGIKAKA